MPVMIPLNDVLASRLKVRASAQRTNLEDFTQHLLEQLLDQLESSEQWRKQNERRLALIAKGSHGPLTPEEERELEHLQAAMDQRLGPGDRQLLAFVTRLEEAAGQPTQE